MKQMDGLHTAQDQMSKYCIARAEFQNCSFGCSIFNRVLLCFECSGGPAARAGFCISQSTTLGFMTSVLGIRSRVTHAVDLRRVL